LNYKGAKNEILTLYKQALNAQKHLRDRNEFINFITVRLQHQLTVDQVIEMIKIVQRELLLQADHKFYELLYHSTFGLPIYDPVIYEMMMDYEQMEGIMDIELIQNMLIHGYTHDYDRYRLCLLHEYMVNTLHINISTDIQYYTRRYFDECEGTQQLIAAADSFVNWLSMECKALPYDTSSYNFLVGLLVDSVSLISSNDPDVMYDGISVDLSTFTTEMNHYKTYKEMENNILEHIKNWYAVFGSEGDIISFAEDCTMFCVSQIATSWLSGALYALLEDSALSEQNYNAFMLVFFHCWKLLITQSI